MRSSENQGDDVYQPQAEAEPGESQPDMQNALGEPDQDDTLDTGYSPPDRPLVAARYGTTAAEQHAGETLDQRLAQQEPDPTAVFEDEPRSETDPGDDWSGAADGDRDGDGGEDITRDPGGDTSTAGRERAGRLAPPDEAGPVRARDTGIDGGAASAEEAAMHVIEDEEPMER
ncbi:DUF5709 domain-containing protein [Streptomyces sp. 12297]|uniref:DUF5709 domain-containing protein n=1 Tax=Streptomyces sp. NBC_00239 TaxID=2903640 RepID=UPI002E28E2C0|nr:DUF5709 domain-containing protein [Streptomyces sp. NBC_00239]